MAELIEICNLSKSYRDKRFRQVQALRDVSFSVAEGEAFGFVGPNGAGKSTTIKILLGLVKPSAGDARIFGHPVSSPLARRGLGYVPENAYLYDYLTPLEILVMGARLHGLPESGLEAHCRQWLERFGLDQVAGRRIRTFSKGMVQRTALAHAMAIRPKLLILDEPLSGLDPIGRKEVVDILLDYRKQGGSILFSSHVLHDVERLADRFGLIHKGTLRTVQRPEELADGDEYFTVRTLGEKAVAGMDADTGGRWHAKVAAADLWPLLEACRLARHRVLEVRPAMSLEQAFLRFTADVSPTVEKAS